MFEGVGLRVQGLGFRVCLECAEFCGFGSGVWRLGFAGGVGGLSKTLSLYP